MKPFFVLPLISALLFLNSACVSTSSNAYSEPSLTEMQRTPAQPASALRSPGLDTSKNFEIQIVRSFDPLQIVSGYTADINKLGSITPTKSSAQMLIPLYGSHSDFAAVGDRDQLWCLTKAIQDGLVESIQIEQQGVKNNWGLFRDSFQSENGVKTYVHLSSGAVGTLGNVESADHRAPSSTVGAGHEQVQPLCSALKSETEASRNSRIGEKVN